MRNSETISKQYAQGLLGLEFARRKLSPSLKQYARNKKWPTQINYGNMTHISKRRANDAEQAVNLSVEKLCFIARLLIVQKKGRHLAVRSISNPGILLAHNTK